MKEIKVTNLSFFYKPNGSKDPQKKSNMAKVVLEMPIAEWHRIKPDILVPNSFPHNRRITDTK